jgi:hypothetical protein
MRRLSKRWEPFRGHESGSLRRSFLSEIAVPSSELDSLAWGCIEYKNPKGPFRLEIWNPLEEDWEEINYFPTLKQAKEVGRLLAGVAFAKNI